MGNKNITNLATPVNNNDAVTKAYVDAISSMLAPADFKFKVNVVYVITNTFTYDYPKLYITRYRLLESQTTREQLTLSSSSSHTFNDGNTSIKVSGYGYRNVGTSEVTFINTYGYRLTVDKAEYNTGALTAISNVSGVVIIPLDPGDIKNTFEPVS